MPPNPTFRKGFALLAALLGQPALAAGPAPAPGQHHIGLVMARELTRPAPPLSLLDLPPPDEGLAGARLALADNETTGRFLHQDFSLDVVQSEKPGDLIAEVRAKVAAGDRFVVADVAPDTLLKLADALKGEEALVFNAGSPDERLREEDCRPNVFHTATSRGMLADALAQYLVWKQWRRWALIVGPTPQDRLFADALKRAAKRFGGKILEERAFDPGSGARRSDGGYEQIQQQMPSFTQSLPDHDILIVADEAQQFGEYVPYRAWTPRPVAGTSGLVASSWHPALEYWGGTQFLNRFQKLAGRPMRPKDYDAWLAVRAVGEAASRSPSADFAGISAYLRSPAFEIAGFKGQKLTFRRWNRQIREPIIIGTPKLPVSVSPQPGFLHPVSELDTLGFDEPETRCHAP